MRVVPARPICNTTAPDGRSTGNGNVVVRRFAPAHFRPLVVPSSLAVNYYAQEFRKAPAEHEGELTCGAQRRILFWREGCKEGKEITIAVSLTLSGIAVAAPPDSRDSAIAPWFESLQQQAPMLRAAQLRIAERQSSGRIEKAKRF